jgi:hypothetical protein
MAKKKTIKKRLIGLGGDLRDLGVIEKDLARVRANLRKFLKGITVESPIDSLDRRQKKMLRALIRRR